MLIRFSAPKHRARTLDIPLRQSFESLMWLKSIPRGAAARRHTLIELKFNLRNSSAHDLPFPSGFVYEIAYATELLLLKILEHKWENYFKSCQYIFSLIHVSPCLPSLAHELPSTQPCVALYIFSLSLSQAHSLSHTCRRKPALRTQ